MDNCPICYEDIPATKNKVITDCNHVFCFTCLIKTVQSDNGFQCPICRKDWEWDENSSSESSGDYEPDFSDTDTEIITEQQDGIEEDSLLLSSQCANRNALINFYNARYKSIKNMYYWTYNRLYKKYNACITRLSELTRYRTISAIQLTLFSTFLSVSAGSFTMYNIISNCADIYNSNFTKSPTMLIINILVGYANSWVLSETTKVIQRDMYHYRFQHGQWHE